MMIFSRGTNTLRKDHNKNSHWCGWLASRRMEKHNNWYRHCVENLSHSFTNIS